MPLMENIRENIRYFWLFLYALVVPFGVIFWSNFSWNHNLELLGNCLTVGGLLLVLYSILFLAFGSLWTPRVNRMVVIGFITVCFLFNMLDLFLFINFQMQVHFILFPLIRNTNLNEARGFFSAYLWNWRNWLVLLYPAIGLGLFFGLKRHCARYAVPVLLLLPPLLAAAFALRPSPDSNRSIVLQLPTMLDNLLDELVEHQFIDQDIAAANRDIAAENHDTDAVYILVIGESHARNHSSLYGYPRETNPLLGRRLADGELISFTDVVSPHSMTTLSLPKVLTFEAHDTDLTYLNSPNLFDIMKKAGFKTWWISNQGHFHDFGTSYVALAKRTDVMEYTSTDWNGQYDEALLPFLEQALQDPAPKKFITLQLVGSHNEYEGTYPPEFRHFPLDEVPDFFVPEQEKHARLVNHYDNSVRYNDFVLDRMVELLKKTGRNGFLLYLSDHGENLYEEHDLATHMEMMPTRWSVEIPMVLYLTPEYLKRAPESLKNELPRAAGRPFNSENLPHLFLELSRTDFELFDPGRSPVNPRFSPRKRVVSSSNADYEKLRHATYEQLLSGRGLE